MAFATHILAWQDVTLPRAYFPQMIHNPLRTGTYSLTHLVAVGLFRSFHLNHAIRVNMNAHRTVPPGTAAYSIVNAVRPIMDGLYALAHALLPPCLLFQLP